MATEQALKGEGVAKKAPRKRIVQSAIAQRTEDLLKGMNITYQKEVRFPDCKDTNTLPFDFMIIVNGHAGFIETDGKQHFEVVPVFHANGEEDLKKGKHHDVIKNKYARDQNNSMLRIAYDQEDKVAHWVTTYITAMKALTNGRVEMYSSPALYKEPYGPHPTPTTQGAGCIVS